MYKEVFGRDPITQVACIMSMMVPGLSCVEGDMPILRVGSVVELSGYNTHSLFHRSEVQLERGIQVGVHWYGKVVGS